MVIIVYILYVDNYDRITIICNIYFGIMFVFDVMFGPKVFCPKFWKKRPTVYCPKLFFRNFSIRKFSISMYEIKNIILILKTKPERFALQDRGEGEISGQ